MSIVVCHHDTQGLANDATIIRELISGDTLVYQEMQLYNNSIKIDPKYKCSIFLEHICPNDVDNVIFIPNIEWPK